MFWEIDWLHGNIGDIDGIFGQECIIMCTLSTLIKTTDYALKIKLNMQFQRKELLLQNIFVMDMIFFFNFQFIDLVCF